MNCGPRISAHALPFDGELDFYLKMILFIRKWLEVVTYFCFIFKRVNKIRNKTLSVTYQEGTVKTVVPL